MKPLHIFVVCLLAIFARSTPAQDFVCVEGVDFTTYPLDTAQISTFWGKPGDTVEMALLWKTDSSFLGFEAVIRYPAEALTPVMYAESAFVPGRTPIDVISSGRLALSDSDGEITSRMRGFSYHITDSNLILVRWVQAISTLNVAPGGAGDIVRVRFVVSGGAPTGVSLPLTIEHTPVVALVGSTYVQFACTIASTSQNWRTGPNPQLPVAVPPVLVAGSFMVDCCDTPGDYNRDGAYDIADINDMVSWLFVGGAPPSCSRESDSDGNRKFNIGDVAYGVAYLFSGGSAPICGSSGI